MRNFTYLGRVIKTQSIVKETILQSKQMGKRENKVINIEGRVQFDLLLILIRDYKLRSYTLNAVSYHFLQVRLLPSSVNITVKMWLEGLSSRGGTFV